MDRHLTTLTDEEMQLVNDREFLLAKVKINSKIQALLSDTRKSLSRVEGLDMLPFLNKNILSKGKISKGENYLGLPYQVLDFPGLFTKDCIFAYRTMFWWGNFFSTTLHLQGDALDFVRQKAPKIHEILINQAVYISVGESPWEYHYGLDNYQLLTDENIHLMENLPFVKLSKKINLDQWENVPSIATEFLQLLVRELK